MTTHVAGRFELGGQLMTMKGMLPSETRWAAETATRTTGGSDRIGRSSGNARLQRNAPAASLDSGLLDATGSIDGSIVNGPEGGMVDAQTSPPHPDGGDASLDIDAGPICASTSGGGAAKLNVDLTSLMNQKVAGTLFGFGTGAFADDGFAFTGVPAIQAQAKVLAPALFRINMNAGAAGTGWEDAIFANGVGSPQWQYFDPLFTNASTWFASNTQVLLGVGSPVNNNISASTLASWATALAQRAKTNGREISLWEVWNEPNGVIPDDTYNDWFGAVADALHAVNPNYLVFGPVHSYVAGYPDTSLQGWANAVGAKAGGICMHTYGFGNWTTDDELFQITDLPTQAATIRQSVAGTPAANLPIVLGEWNIDGSGASVPQEQGIQGAIYNAINMYRTIDLNINAQYGANWEIFGDGTYGVINDPANGQYNDYRIFPPGYYLGYAGQTLDGDRVTATLSASGNLYALAVVKGNRFTVQIINYDTSAAQTGFTVDIKAAHGIGANVTRWELSPAHLTPDVSTVPCGSLVGAGTSVPAESIVILTGTFL